MTDEHACSGVDKACRRWSLGCRSAQCDRVPELPRSTRPGGTADHDFVRIKNEHVGIDADRHKVRAHASDGVRSSSPIKECHDPAERRLGGIGIRYRHAEADEHLCGADCMKWAFDHLSRAFTTGYCVFGLPNQGWITRGYDATTLVEHEEVHAGRAAVLYRYEERGDPFIEVIDANLTHHVLRGE